MKRRVTEDERRLAETMADGTRRRPEQAFGAYFEGKTRSDAFGAAYEGIYRLPADATGIRPRGLYRFFACLDNTVYRCPAGCGKELLLDSLLIHLNDDHQWTREQIGAWVGADQRPVSPPGKAAPPGAEQG
jgi:hypothetical protein